MKKNRRYKYTWVEFDKDVKKIVEWLKGKDIRCIYAVPKGGLVLGVVLANHLGIPLFMKKEGIIHYDKSEVLICDDVSDTGNTLKRLVNRKDGLVVTLFIKPQTKFMPHFYCRQVPNDTWIVFCWEEFNV